MKLTQPLILSLLLVALCTSMLHAQDAEIIGSMSKYKTVESMTANVLRTKHNALLADDIQTQGTLYYLSPGRVCLSFDGGNDRMLVDGPTFALTSEGKTQIVKGKMMTLIDQMLTVFKVEALGLMEGTDISDMAKVSVEKQGNLRILAITPVVNLGEKAKKRMLFTSLALTFDLRSGEIKSMKMNEQGENYTLYELSGYNLKATVDESVFSTGNEGSEK